MEIKSLVHDEECCRKVRLALRDTLDVVGGKWKLILISMLGEGTKKFKQIAREADISPRILSKELKELELHGLVKRTVCDTRPVSVEYALTPYSETLFGVIKAMHDWGAEHRRKFVGE